MTIIYSHKTLKDREPSDFYPTPYELCREALLSVDILSYSNEGIIQAALDVGAGDGVWGQALKDITTSVYLTGIDVRPEAKFRDLLSLPVEGSKVYDESIIQDFLKYDGKHDLIFGNIPFRHANEFISHSLNLLTEKGIIVYLLQSAISESKKRYDLFFNNGHKPKYIYQSVRRISFTGNKKSDNTAYSIFVWEKDKKERETITRWLDWNYEET